MTDRFGTSPRQETTEPSPISSSRDIALPSASRGRRGGGGDECEVRGRQHTCSCLFPVIGRIGDESWPDGLFGRDVEQQHGKVNFLLVIALADHYGAIRTLAVNLFLLFEARMTFQCRLSLFEHPDEVFSLAEDQHGCS